jgi:superfamily I DNA/RNA helicase
MPALTKHQPTNEQQAIIDFALTDKRSMIVNALAGAAKTTTLEMICAALPVQPILSLAFNKRIAEEMKKRLPGHVSPATMNSVGHRVWAAAIGRNIIIDPKKNFNLLSQEMESLSTPQRSKLKDSFTPILNTIRAAKSAGYAPSNAPRTQVEVINSNDFYNALDEDLSVEEITVVERVLLRNIKSAYNAVLDYDDQIYMPTLFGGSFPQFPLVLVDEAQDLSLLNHAMLRKLVPNRIIAVGDPHQSIYAFRGAATNSMSVLEKNFSMEKFPLNTSFRCPQAVVRFAQQWVPYMRPASFAPEGSVNTLGGWTVDDIPDNAAIICRNNAPLAKMAINLLRRGRPARVIGSDIGLALIRGMRQLGAETLTRPQALIAVDRWESVELQKRKNKTAISDRAECMRTFINETDTLGEAITFTDHVLKGTGTIHLLTGHKAKGLEWDDVFHLDPHLIPAHFAQTDEEIAQENNLAYVITTRAKQTLTHITTGGLQ